MLKRMTVALLLLLVVLGGAIAVYSEDELQTVEGKIGCTVTINTPSAADDDSWTVAPFAYDGSALDTASYTETIIVSTNCPYDLTLKVHTDAYPTTGETTPDAFMTGSISPYTDLTNELQIAYASGATSTDATLSTTDISTAAKTVVSCPEVPSTGSDSVVVTISQGIVAGDPAYEVASEITYQIKLLWSVSAGV